MKIIQLYHPGPEPRVSKGSDCCDWNVRETHCRKFMCTTGDCIGSDGAHEDNVKLEFWGEWEAPSKCSRVNNISRKGNWPKHVHEPFVCKPRPKGALNTDPFVFIEGFVYSCCMIKGYPSLQELQRGDLLLFGSSVGRKFVLDTVFVIERRQSQADFLNEVEQDHPYAKEIILQGKIQPDGYVYRGATFDKPVDGMYSFVPCRKSTSENKGFERPTLEGASQIVKYVLSKEGKTQGIKCSYAKTDEVWRDLCDYLRGEGFLEGLVFNYSVKKCLKSNHQ